MDLQFGGRCDRRENASSIWRVDVGVKRGLVSRGLSMALVFQTSA